MGDSVSLDISPFCIDVIEEINYNLSDLRIIHDLKLQSFFTLVFSYLLLSYVYFGLLFSKARQYLLFGLIVCSLKMVTAVFIFDLYFMPLYVSSLCVSVAQTCTNLKDENI